MKIINKYLILPLFLLGVSIFSLPVFAQTPPAADTTANPLSDNNAQMNAFLPKSGIIKTTVSGISGTIITAILGLLGLIFVVLLVYAGFQWMTAEGNEEKVEKAKGTITRAVIGLAIVIAAYAITYFVFNSLNGAVNQNP
jgi:hypothetical protein